ncbi:hypothetical protein ACFYRN_22700 [Streptomyces sp. NPDC005227]|uniref:hypothetical protein n=1 Tax=Streptomyces sp. NPDC005227 TaxID=3364707 RepID=UPI00369AFCE6
MTAHVLADDAGALALAVGLAEVFRPEAPVRSAERRLPRAGSEALQAAGPLAVTRAGTGAAPAPTRLTTPPAERPRTSAVTS